MSETEEMISEEELIEIFIERHPHLKERLKVLSEHFANKGGLGVFAPIKGESCGACRVRIASARLQQTLDGSFISCANCARYLYLASKVLNERSHTQTNP